MKLNKKISTLLATLLFGTSFANLAHADLGSIALYANTDNSGNEGVYITSNGNGAYNNAQAYINVSSNSGNGGSGNVTIGSSGGINLMNDTSLTGNLGVSGNTSVGGTLGVTGLATLNGGAAITGATTINNTGSANTTIGNSLNTTTINSGTTNINSTTNITGATTVIGVTSVTGTTTINTTGTAATTIGNTHAEVNATGYNSTASLANNASSFGTADTASGLGGSTKNGLANTNTNSTMSGGSSQMVLDNNGATFGNRANNNAPIQVHGVADGTANFDAVNVQQLNAVKKGIAGVAAMSNIPALDASKQYNIGVGIGGFDGETSLALGGNARVLENLTVRASVGHSFSSNNSNIDATTWGVGAALAW
jgi:hypothetical protein